MKTVIIKNYIQGLASYLDEKNITWSKVDDTDAIKIHYNTDEDLFRIGFGFGVFYTNN